MKNKPVSDSNAVALSMRNFGAMPHDISSLWISQFAMQKKSMVPLPEKVIIEIANTCNLDCPMCRVGQFGIDLSRVLPLADFRNIIAQLKGVKVIRLNGLGESTLVPGLDRYLDVLFEKEITVELISNGSGQQTYYETILKNSGVVLISWDAAEKEVFERLRRPAKWEAYTEKLIALARFASGTNSSDRLSLLYTLQKHNISQVKKLVTKCEEWDIKNIIVNVVKLSNTYWIQDHILEIRNEFTEASHLALEKGIALLLPSSISGAELGITGSIRTSASHCTMPWEEAVIRWNGDVQVCNMFNPYTYGNIFINDLETIWNNSFANLFRKYINTDKKHPYCNGCVYIKDAYEHRKG